MNANELLRTLGSDLGLSQSELLRISASAPFRYKHYTLPKRSGGFRDIYHPTPELKAIQWWIVKNIVGRLPVHDNVYSYRKGLSIKDHATAHIGSNYFYRIDFSDFFPSIKHSDVVALLAHGCRDGILQLDKAAIAIVSRLVCRAPKGRAAIAESLALSIGAPSSPAISNAILFNFDSRLAQLCGESDVRYTRYADDLFFSTRHPHSLEHIAGVVRREVEHLDSPKLAINEDKTSSVSRKHRVKITGVIITPRNELSIGRNRKRLVKSLVHSFLHDKLSSDEAGSLRGLIAFISSIEPNFLQRLEQKYGKATIERLMKGG